MKHVCKFIYAPSKVWLSLDRFFYTNLTFSRQIFVRNSYAEFHGSPTDCLVADIRPQIDGHGLHVGPYFLFCKERLEQARSIFYVVRATLVKFDLHASNMKYNMQNEEWISMHIIICIILFAYFL